MATAGLDALTGILMRACGELIVARHDAKGVVHLRVRQQHSEAFKKAVHGYVKAYSREHDANITVAFPRPWEIRLRVRERSSR